MADEIRDYKKTAAEAQLVINGGNVQARIKTLRAKLREYLEADSSPVRIYVVGKGGHAFGQQVLRGLTGPFEQECIYTRRYCEENQPILFEVLYQTGSADCIDYRVVVLDDLLDSGETQYRLAEIFRRQGALEVKAMTLLDKVSQRDDAYPVDVLAVGFEIANLWVFGEGMDAFGYDALRYKRGVWCPGDQVMPEEAYWLPEEQ